jgi:NAD(P)-binding Rossmann-like domain
LLDVPNRAVGRDIAAGIPLKAYDFIILGCGVAGLCTAKLLLNAGHSDILMLDEYPEPGGNQISREINGYTFDIGAFYFWPTMPLFGMYPEVLTQCVRCEIPIQRVTPGGFVGTFPFSLKREFIELGPRYWLGALWSVMAARMRMGQKDFQTAEDYAIYYMGRRLYSDLGLSDYLIRFFSLPPDKIEAQFAYKRLEFVRKYGDARHWIDRGKNKLRACIARNSESPREILVVRPETGFGQMYGAAVQSLRASGVAVRLGYGISGINKDKERFIIEGPGGSIETSNLLNTIPLKQICAHFGIGQDRDLECVDLLTLFVSFEGRRNFDGVILYNWGRFGRWKRLTMHSDYYGRRHGREYFNVEVPLFREADTGPDDIYADFVRSAQAYRVFDGDLRLEGHEITRNAYPAYTLGTTDKVDKALMELKRLGIQSVGRQGRFDYLPTGMHVVNQVSETLRR